MDHPYASFVHAVEKPARYLGGEYQQRVKDPASVEASIALAFPDVYDLGMSHLGTKILYKLLNDDPRIACERAFAPWPDMERELRARALPLVTLESARPLCAFDFVGVSLQYELTYTNVLTLLDLGGLPLRAADRGDGDPLVIGGGPTATHPEPVAPFFDLFLIGEAEEVLPELLLAGARLRAAGRPRREVLAELAARGAVYVPSLYETTREPDTGLEVVARPLDPRAPARVRRAWVRDLDRFPFPDDSPVPHAEAVFDRAAIEIARGCTEGCRFCQAGMIYRPVRERSPQAVVDAVVRSVERSGYDEVSLTSLSTADYSCVEPLVHEVTARLRTKKVALSVSSLRAYGLTEEILDDISSVRATGLTFAPEAGTQRMRDVINKNVTEADLEQSAERVFGRGWSRMKLYFMIGLPTETDEDVLGIPRTGGRVQRLGRRVNKAAQVTVSVSSHVPKPHTPFQWAAMDPLEELERKQRLLRAVADGERVTLRHHDAATSFVEGILARGDRRLADVVEAAWRAGARFDGWEEHFSLPRWQVALESCGVSPEPYLGTLPVSARLPWDHVDIGLEDGFLLAEYRRAVKDRLSPPCGKPFGKLLHHTNVADALAEAKRLVCYDCGVACDLTQMKEERLVFLRSLGAEVPRPARPPEEAAARRALRVRDGRPQPPLAAPQGPAVRLRLRYTKLGVAAFTSHLDVMRQLQRILRRAGLTLGLSQGFHPKPLMVLGPALGLGIASLGELVDVTLAGAPLDDEAALCARLEAVAPRGLSFVAARSLGPLDPPLARLLTASDLAVGLPLSEGDAAARASALLGASALPMVRTRRKQGAREVDLRRHVRELAPITGAAATALRARLGWPAELALLQLRLEVAPDGTARPSEIGAALCALPPAAALEGVRYARLALWADGPAGEPLDPLDLEAVRPTPAAAPPPVVDAAPALVP